MKKTVIFLTLVMMVMLTLTACKKNSAAGDDTTAGGTSSENGKAAEQANDRNDEVTYGIQDGTVVFTASLDFKLEDSSAWLGVIPTGTKYEKEADADDVDMLYCYVSNYDDETKSSYRFEFDKEYFHGIGDGTFDMVLTSSDNGEIGKVLLQIGIEIKGEKITLDFENRK